AETELRDVPHDRALFDPEQSTRAIVHTARGLELVVSVPAARGRFPANEAYYWVLFREPSGVAYATARVVQRYVWLGAVVLFAFAVLMMLWLGRWLNRRVAVPVRSAGDVAARVASGDLTVAGGAVDTVSDEIVELLSSVQAMVVALRRLVGAIRTAADEAAAMATEISAAAEQRSASAEQMSATCQDLTKRAAEQAQMEQAGAGDARPADAARPGRGRRARRGTDRGPGPRDGGRGGSSERRLGSGDREDGRRDARPRGRDQRAARIGRSGHRDPARVGGGNRRLERGAERVRRG